jgi:hypothetical protein
MPGLSAIGTLRATQYPHPLVERDMIRLCCGKLLHLSCKSIADRVESDPSRSIAFEKHCIITISRSCTIGSVKSGMPIVQAERWQPKDACWPNC